MSDQKIFVQTDPQEHDATNKAKRVNVVAGTITVDTIQGEVEITNEIGNPIPVNDAGGSLTVDGAVIANAGANLNTSALALEAGGNLAGAATSLASIDGKTTIINTGAVIVDGGQLGTSGSPVEVDIVAQTLGSVTVGGDVGSFQQVAITGELKTVINNAAGASAVNVQDGGNTLTVDGSVSVSNAAGASAVNIQDGGNTITVDGTVNATCSGSVSVSNAAGASAVNIQDGGNTITVDGTVNATCSGTVAVSTDPVPTKEKICDSNPTLTRVTVNAAATALPAGALANRREVYILNDTFSTGILCVGFANSVVTTESNANRGIPLAAGQSITLEVGPNVTLFGICAAAGNTLNVLVIESTKTA